MSLINTLRYAVLLVSFLAMMPLAAQTGDAVVQGTLLDASKAALPNGKVFLKNSETGVLQTTTSNNSGVYYFGGVPPGAYVLSAEAAGFRKWEGTVTVEVGQKLTIDPTLEVGSAGSTVEVTDAAPIIATEG